VWINLPMFEYSPTGFALSAYAQEEFSEFVTNLNVQIAPEIAHGSLSCLPVWAALLVLTHDYEIQHKYVVIKSKMSPTAYICVLSKINVDSVITFFATNKCDYVKTFLLFDDIYSDFEFGEDFEHHLKHCKKGVSLPPTNMSGQLKLLVNAITLIDRSKGTVVVIGGGGPFYVTSGLSYHALAEMLPEMQFLIYDPLETYSVHADKPSNVTVFSQFFDYDQKKSYPDVNYVIDDVYYEVPAPLTRWTDRPVRDQIHEGYKGKFVVVVQKGEYVLIPTPQSHSNTYHTWIMGGGEIDKTSRPFRVYSSSGKFGPYDKEVIKKVGGNWIIDDSRVFTNLLQYNSLKSIFPNAAITMKALVANMKDYENCEIRDQYFYSGPEKRLYYNSRPMSFEGVQCVTCHFVRGMMRRLNVIESDARLLFVKVGGHSCQSFSHATKIHVSFEIKQLARKWAPKSFVVKEICRKYNYTEATVLSLLALKESAGELKLYKSYDGGRYGHVKYQRPPKFIARDKMTYFLKGLSFFLKCCFSGLSPVVGGPLNGYYGPHFRWYMDVIIPVDYDSKMLSDLEPSHTIYETPIRMFIRKDAVLNLENVRRVVEALCGWKGVVRYEEDCVWIDGNPINEDNTYVDKSFAKYIGYPILTSWKESFIDIMRARQQLARLIPYIVTSGLSKVDIPSVQN